MSNLRQQQSREVTDLNLIGDPGDVFKNPGQLQFVRSLMDVLKRALGNVVRRDVATPQIILRSPNGQSYAVRVGNDGVMTATLVDRQDRVN